MLRPGDRRCGRRIADAGHGPQYLQSRTSGNIVYAYRMDGNNPIEVDTAWRKAQTVLYMRMSTHAMNARYGQGMQATMFNLGQFPYTGGLPIMVGKQMIGAIGVGGATGPGDERCAWEAMTKVIGPQPPLVTD